MGSGFRDTGLRGTWGDPGEQGWRGDVMRYGAEPDPPTHAERLAAIKAALRGPAADEAPSQAGDLVERILANPELEEISLEQCLLHGIRAGMDMGIINASRWYRDSGGKDSAAMAKYTEELGRGDVMRYGAEPEAPSQAEIVQWYMDSLVEGDMFAEVEASPPRGALSAREARAMRAMRRLGIPSGMGSPSAEFSQSTSSTPQASYQLYGGESDDDAGLEDIERWLAEDQPAPQQPPTVELPDRTEELEGLFAAELGEPQYGG